MNNMFLRHALLLFLALRVGDFVGVAAGMWFVPKYVSPEEIGAVLPATSFAVFLSLPVFAFAMTAMKESACLAADGETGKIKSLLCGVFVSSAILLAAVLSVASFAVPRFLSALGISNATAGSLAVLAGFLGCVAPVYTDALQSLKKFGSLAAIETVGALARFAAMAATMPFFGLAGYFAGQAVLPAFRMAGSVSALRRELSVKSAPFWNAAAARRMTRSFIAILVYQAAPMACALAEQSVLRVCLDPGASAGYYMATRFSDFLYCLTFPLLLAMFPYTAGASRKGGDTRPFVVKCSLLALSAAAAMSAAYAFFGRDLLSLMPSGPRYADYARYMPLLTAVTALTSCQVFYTNAEVSAGRFGFLRWFVPLHAAYPAALCLAAHSGICGSLDAFLAWFAAAAALRFIFSAVALEST